MIEGRLLPIRSRVATLALRAIPAFVNVVLLMATDARHRHLTGGAAAGMTSVAGDRCVAAQKWEVRLLAVVERHGRPFDRRMTALAARAVGTVVFVVELVTRKAIGRRFCVAFVGMAAFARRLRVLARQRKVRRIVIELCLFPSQVCMARRAVRAQAAAMAIVGPMAIDADLRRRRVLCARFVARSAGNVCVPALERIVGELMIEIVAVEERQRRVSALVLRMALAAGGGTRAGISTVIAEAPNNLCIDRLMTIAAKLCLPLLVELHVTILAVGSQLLVLLAQLARRHQLVEYIRRA